MNPAHSSPSDFFSTSILISPSRLYIPVGLFPSGLPTINVFFPPLFFPLRATFLATTISKTIGLIIMITFHTVSSNALAVCSWLHKDNFCERRCRNRSMLCTGKEGFRNSHQKPYSFFYLFIYFFFFANADSV